MLLLINSASVMVYGSLLGLIGGLTSSAGVSAEDLVSADFVSVADCESREDFAPVGNFVPSGGFVSVVGFVPPGGFASSPGLVSSKTLVSEGVSDAGLVSVSLSGSNDANDGVTSPCGGVLWKSPMIMVRMAQTMTLMREFEPSRWRKPPSAARAVGHPASGSPSGV